MSKIQKYDIFINGQKFKVYMNNTKWNIDYKNNLSKNKN